MGLENGETPRPGHGQGADEVERRFKVAESAQHPDEFLLLRRREALQRRIQFEDDKRRLFSECLGPAAFQQFFKDDEETILLDGRCELDRRVASHLRAVERTVRSPIGLGLTSPKATIGVCSRV